MDPYAISSNKPNAFDIKKKTLVPYDNIDKLFRVPNLIDFLTSSHHTYGVPSDDGKRVIDKWGTYNKTQPHFNDGEPRHRLSMYRKKGVVPPKIPLLINPEANPYYSKMTGSFKLDDKGHAVKKRWWGMGGPIYFYQVILIISDKEGITPSSVLSFDDATNEGGGVFEEVGIKPNKWYVIKEDSHIYQSGRYPVVDGPWIERTYTGEHQVAIPKDLLTAKKLLALMGENPDDVEPPIFLSTAEKVKADRDLVQLQDLSYDVKEMVAKHLGSLSPVDGTPATDGVLGKHDRAAIDDGANQQMMGNRPFRNPNSNKKQKQKHGDHPNPFYQDGGKKKKKKNKGKNKIKRKNTQRKRKNSQIKRKRKRKRKRKSLKSKRR